MAIKGVGVRNETVLCMDCGKPTQFFCLPDFAYGEWLTSVADGTCFAYVNLLEDSLYKDFISMVKNGFGAQIIKRGNLLDAAVYANVFGVTCDEIDGCPVDFGKTKRICKYCLSVRLDTHLAERATSGLIDAVLVTHERWTELDEREKIARISDELVAKGYI
jgi:hypothetical protein